MHLNMPAHNTVRRRSAHSPTGDPSQLAPTPATGGSLPMQASESAVKLCDGDALLPYDGHQQEEDKELRTGEVR